MNVRIDPSWKKALEQEWSKEYFIRLTNFVRSQYATRMVYPPAGQIFAAFDSYPYPGAGQANGLSFSVNPGVELPRSLRNIYKELESDLQCTPPANGDLSRWARQGVLLLNATLTVNAGSPASHQNQGWEEFTDAAIRALATQREGIVYILWGAYAQRKGEFIDRTRNCVITSPHPSPLSASRGFFGSRPFSRANEYLVARGETPINWCD